MSNFEHVALQILSNLDINSLLQCRLVNKTWDEFIIDRKYIWKLLLRQLVAKGCDPDAYAKCSEKWMKVFEYFHDNPNVSAEDLQNLVYFVKINIDFWRDTLHKEYCCNSKIEPYKCPLNSVLKFGDIEVIKLILSIPDKRLITCTVNLASSPLQIACEREDIDLAKLVLKHSKDLNFTINDMQSLWYQSVFQYVCQTGKLEMVKFFLNLPEEMDLNYYGDPEFDDAEFDGLHKDTPFSRACDNEQMEIIKILLEYSLRPDTKIDYLPHINKFISDMHPSCYSKMPWKTFKFLLNFADEHSIDIDLVDEYGIKCLASASVDNNLEMVQFIVGYLTQKKVNMKKVKCYSSGKNTPLHYASEEGHLDVVKYFVENKIFKPDHKDENKWPPLFYAKRRGHQDVVDYLYRASKPLTWFLTKRRT